MVPPFVRPEAELLRALADNAQSMLAYWDSTLRCRFANRAYEKWFGVSPESLIGRHIRELLGPLYERNLPYIEGALRGEPQEFERELPNPSGGPPRHSLASYLPDLVDGVVLGFFVVVTDITKQRVGEEAFRTAALSREVLDGLLEGCQVIGPDWRYLYLNDLAAAQGRKLKEELVGRTMMECYPGIDTTPMFSKLRQCMTERRHDWMTNDFTFPDGSQICFDLRFVPVPQGVCILSLDVTERRHRLAAIVNDSDDAIIGRTLDGIITSWNKSAERMFGFSADETIGKSMTALVPTHLKDEEEDIRKRLVEGKRIEHFETVRLNRDGAMVDVSATYSPIRDSTGAIIGVSKIMRDISEAKRRERALVRAKLAAESANRELESFSYSVAHDLRAPLRTIDGFSQAIIEDCADKLDEGSLAYLHRVRGAAQHMAQLIDDMLLLSRVTRAELARTAVDLSALASAVGSRLVESTPTRHVKTVIEPALEARGDPRLLALVFDNLLGNAWKFTSKRDDARIEFGAVMKDGVRAYFVRDNGAGFDMAYANKLFGVFQRLHSNEDFEGTGVGLATVQRVVHRHGGRVWAEGEVGVGACFYFTLGNEEQTV
jgi:PAS domain S-box-containing protein